MSFLYGMSIQGIQSYIFATDKLKEIVGASTLVSELPRVVFEEILGVEVDENQILLDAAGNFKYIFKESEKDKCELLYRCLPKRFAEKAGNITVSQAVVKFEDLQQKHVNELELKLKAQRNIPKKHRNLGWMSMAKNPRTGLPIIKKESSDFLDVNQSLKREKYKEDKGETMTEFFSDTNGKKFTDDIENITSDDFENWIAVIHADGNSLGTLIKNLTKDSTDIKQTYKSFSENLKKATESAVNAAFKEVILKKDGHLNHKIPFRPIIIGGDDVTVVTRGDLALEFTQKYLEYFEQTTEEYLGNRLTACAGIAYIKSHYPFHYGAALAEELCTVAKKDSKSISSNNPPSSLMFHRMQSSFVRKWKQIGNTELKAGNISLMNGPYYIKDQQSKMTVDKLIDYVEILAEPNAPKSGIRQWLSELDKDTIRAKELMKRIMSNDKRGSYTQKLDLNTCIGNSTQTHLYDALVIEDLRGKTEK